MNPSKYTVPGEARRLRSADHSYFEYRRAEASRSNLLQQYHLDGLGVFRCNKAGDVDTGGETALCSICGILYNPGITGHPAFIYKAGD